MYDFTIPEDFYDKNELIDILNNQCSRWVFQKEQGKKGLKEGYLHWQIRISLKKKMRWSSMKKTPIMKGHHTPTSNPTFKKGDFFYVMKEDTRVDGPWKNTDEPKTETTQLKMFMKWDLRPYQKSIIEEATKFDLRAINLIWDTTGCCGKSLLSEYMEYLNIAEEIPPFRLMDDIFQWVCSRGIKVGFKKSYIVDMPRGMKKDRLGDFYSGIEVIKNGVAYDKRNSAKKCRFNRPRIFVFTNTLPCFALMSHDRWVVWKIKKDFTYEVIR